MRSSSSGFVFIPRHVLSHDADLWTRWTKQGSRADLLMSHRLPQVPALIGPGVFASLSPGREHAPGTPLTIHEHGAIWVLLRTRFLATVGGRVNINPESGLAEYKRPPGAIGWVKLKPGMSLFQTLYNTGVTGSPLIRKGGNLMMITAVSYLLIQVRGARRIDRSLPASLELQRRKRYAAP